MKNILHRSGDPRATVWIAFKHLSKFRSLTSAIGSCGRTWALTPSQVPFNSMGYPSANQSISCPNHFGRHRSSGWRLSVLLALGIRSRLLINQHNENVNSIHIRYVSIQAIVRMKSRMICYRGYSKILRKNPRLSAYNKCWPTSISLSCISNSFSILEHFYHISTNASVSLMKIPSPLLIAPITKCRIPPSSLSLSHLLTASLILSLSSFFLRKSFLFYWMRLTLNCSSQSLIYWRVIRRPNHFLFRSQYTSSSFFVVVVSLAF